MALFHRHIPPRPNPLAVEPDRSAVAPGGGLPVLLSPGLVDLAPALAQALGGEFAVQTEGRGGEGVMVVGPSGPAGIAFLRASHPGVALLVVDRRGGRSSATEAVVHLEAGADGYLAGPPVAEVASHVRALARRRTATATTAVTAATHAARPRLGRPGPG